MHVLQWLAELLAIAQWRGRDKAASLSSHLAERRALALLSTEPPLSVALEDWREQAIVTISVCEGERMGKVIGISLPYAAFVFLIIVRNA